MTPILKPLAVGLMLAASTWAGSAAYGQAPSTPPTLAELQASLVEVQAKISQADPNNQGLMAELNQALAEAQNRLNVHLEANHKAPEQAAAHVQDHSINTNVQVADPNWVPSFISTGDADQDAQIIHQYKVSKGLQKDEE